MNARLEFDALWREGERLSIPKSILSDTLSVRERQKKKIKQQNK